LTFRTVPGVLLANNLESHVPAERHLTREKHLPEVPSPSLATISKSPIRAGTDASGKFVHAGGPDDGRVASCGNSGSVVIEPSTAGDQG